MGIYNILTAEIQCPRCRQLVVLPIELYFGYRNLIEYRPGDTYQWSLRRALQHGGRPDHGDLDGEGYAVCPLCQRDFFVNVAVRNDILTAVRVDTTRCPHIPD